MLLDGYIKCTCPTDVKTKIYKFTFSYTYGSIVIYGCIDYCIDRGMLDYGPSTFFLDTTFLLSLSHSTQYSLINFTLLNTFSKYLFNLVFTSLLDRKFENSFRTALFYYLWRIVPSSPRVLAFSISLISFAASIVYNIHEQFCFFPVICLSSIFSILAP